MALSSDETRVLRGGRTDLYHGGEWQPSSSGRSVPVEDPSTGETIAEVADATPDEGLEALGIAAA